jgi:hypothetical protein
LAPNEGIEIKASLPTTLGRRGSRRCSCRRRPGNIGRRVHALRQHASGRANSRGPLVGAGVHHTDRSARPDPGRLPDVPDTASISNRCRAQCIATAHANRPSRALRENTDGTQQSVPGRAPRMGRALRRPDNTRPQLANRCMNGETHPYVPRRAGAPQWRTALWTLR